MIVDIIGVLLSAVIVVAASEGLSWYWVYRNEDYQKLSSQIDRLTKTVEDKKSGPLTAKEAKTNKKITRVEDQLKLLTTQLAAYNLKVAVVNIVVVLLGYQFLSSTYEGVVVAKLPFTPFAFFANVTHRGLPGDDYTDASAHLIFALGLVLFRSNVQKAMEHYGFKPRAPKQPSLWDMANAEAEKLEKTQ